MSTKKYRLVHNSRFYILISSLLVSIIVASIVRLQVPSDQLFTIRTQQLFGLLCIIYWYIALMISPLGYLIGKARMRQIEYARRAIGVSAAYYATLHAAIALWGQLGGIEGIGTLSPLFKWSLAAGLSGLVVLLLMAATSFDKVIRILTFRRWKWLHRLAYIGGILVVFHVWTIGTHVGYGAVQILAFIALALLAGLEINRITILLSRKYIWLRPPIYRLSVAGLLWCGVAGLLLMIPMISNYRDDLSHDQHNSSLHESGHDDH